MIFETSRVESFSHGNLRSHMSETTYPVEVQPDYLEKITHAKPPQALAELIWNALDADADNVSVRFGFNELERPESIQVRDNGVGIPYDKAPEYFRRLGGSWKRPGAKTSEKQRFLHGQEGRGRFKALALGGVVRWEVTYPADGGYFTYEISISNNHLREVRISEPVVAEAPRRSGVTLTIDNLYSEAESLLTGSTHQELTEIFALYLANYRDAHIEVNGAKLDIAKCIVSRESRKLAAIVDGESTYEVDLDIVEWRDATNRSLYLCNHEGLPLSRLERRFHIGSFQFSAYLKSTFVTELQAKGELDTAEMNPLIVQSVDGAQDEIKSYFQKRAAEDSRTVVEEWKEQKIYPFRGEARSQIEVVERQVFDIVAVSAAKYIPDFATTENKARALQLRLLKAAIEKSPSELQTILGEVLKLPRRKQQELANLLKDVSLSSIISAAKTVADRLDFIVALDSILYDKGPKQRLKERTQLHRILAKNAWIFGEEFNISICDRGLTEVLRQHKKLLGEDVVVEAPVKHYSQERGIVDLVLSRTIRRHHAPDLSHLVVELKAPKVTVDLAEINQIEQYALSIQNDARFKTDKKTTWTYWVISDDYGPYAKHRMSQHPHAPGRIHNDENSSIWVRTWAQVLEENRSRMQFFQERLEYEADKGAALRRLQKRHSDLLEGVLDAEDLASKDSDSSVELITEPEDFEEDQANGEEESL
jgi:hypothetical protein